MPLPARPSICFLCQSRVTLFSSPTILSTWQATRNMATLRLRRKAARMALSPDVSKSTINKPRSHKGPAGPFASMNQTQARIREDTRPRSQAALKRSGDRSKDSKDQKPDAPLYKALKMQTSLSPVTYGRRTAIKHQISAVTSFDHFPLLPTVRQSIFDHALSNLSDVTPTPIQRLAIPQLLGDGLGRKKSVPKTADEPPYDQFLLAAETGSGKTLAYLLPLIDHVKRAEAQEKEEEKILAENKAKEREERIKNHVYDIEPEEPPMSNAGRPRAIILVPTSELVTQVITKLKELSHGVKFRSAMISSSLSTLQIKRCIFMEGLDILVATPHLLASIAKTNPYILSRVSYLVLDEADSLMDRSFLPTTMEVVNKASASLKKLVFCSATIPRSFDTQLRKLYPNVKRLTTPNLHAIPRRVQLGVVDIEKEPYRGNRMLACADVIWQLGKAGDISDGDGYGGPLTQYMGPTVKKIIVFVNEREESEDVARFLKSKGIDAISLSRDSVSRKTEEILAEFTQVDLPPTSDQILLAQKEGRKERSMPFVLPEQKAHLNRTLPNTRVLVTTDITSRGVDTLAVKTVILYHVPHTTVDFIHRLGRLGRMGKRGRGVVLVGKKDRKDVVREVREGMFRGQALI